MNKSIIGFMQVFAAATRTGHAVTNGHRPLARDLETLGIRKDRFL